MILKNGHCIYKKYHNFIFVFSHFEVAQEHVIG